MSFLTSKSVAILAEGNTPHVGSVDDIVNVALTFQMPVCIICFTQEILDHWLATSKQCAADPALPSLNVFDSNQATLTDWTTYLQNENYHIIILAGAHTELQTDRLSEGYIQQFIEAVPKGLVVLA
ncbi:MAG: hypothetical protein AAF485_30420 [Chloroflexota bacterium]